MTEVNGWIQCQQMTRVEFRRSGGCLWPVQPNSPGMSLRIPNETSFKIRLEGPESRKYVDGICSRGYFVVLGLPGKGEYPSANEAVVAARPQVEASNAYLYIEFKVGGSWILSEDLRYRRDLAWSPSRAEEEAMRLARNAIRVAAKKQEKIISAGQVEIKAEE